MQDGKHIEGVSVDPERVLKLDPMQDMFRKPQQYSLLPDIKKQLRDIAKEIGGLPEAKPIYAEEHGTSLRAMGYTHVSKKVAVAVADNLKEIQEQKMPILDGMTYRVALKFEVLDMDIPNKLFDAYKDAGIKGVHTTLVNIAVHETNARRTLPQFFGADGKYLGAKHMAQQQAAAKEEQPVKTEWKEVSRSVN